MDESVPDVLGPTGEPDPPLAVVPLFSGGASAARYCEARDGRFGDAYEFPVAISSDPDAPGIDRLDTPVEVRDIHGFYADRAAEIDDMTVRREYDATLRDHLAEYDPDILLLSGYMYIVTDALLSAYPAVNVHPADLRITDGGSRTYTGIDAVYDAIVAGETETRSSVHFVTEGVDEGPLLVVSPPAPVHRPLVSEVAGEAVQSYADAHQTWMKGRCDGPALTAAFHLLADGRVTSTGADLTVDGTPGPHVVDPVD